MKKLKQDRPKCLDLLFYAIFLEKSLMNMHKQL
ncbi:uncharacterized protein METZ01_LOCUS114628 [marine metagenome]|uniref:Uncharacterized protein n=1 Tax=marine metagenome TaxID=408172 RepID=A0A381XAL8_9ZZZZ